jgi:hypothetical protein
MKNASDARRSSKEHGFAIATAPRMPHHAERVRRHGEKAEGGLRHRRAIKCLLHFSDGPILA